MIVYNTTVMVATGSMVAMMHFYGTLVLSATFNSIIILLIAIMIVEQGSSLIVKPVLD